MADQKIPAEDVEARRIFRIVIKCLAAAAAIALLLIALLTLLDLLVLGFGAVTLSVLLRAIAEPIHRRTRLPHRGAVAVAVLVVLAVVACGAWLFGRQLQGQLAQLTETLPAAWATLKVRIADLPGGHFLLHSLEQASGRGSTSLVPHLEDLVGRVGTVVTDLLLLIVGSIYIAANPTLYKTGLLLLVPPRWRALADETLSDCDRALRHWLVGQLVSMALVGTLTGVGLWLAGVPSAAALGFISALTEIIPYAGPILAAIPGLILSATVSAGTALSALIVYTAVQQIEGHAIMPLVQKRAVALPPALTAFGVVGAGMLFGVPGLFFAGPLIVTLYVLTKRLYVQEALHTATPIPGGERR